MPSYSYKCEEHGETTVVKSIKDSDKEELCPVCNKPMNRIFGAVTSIWRTTGAFGKSK